MNNREHSYNSSKIIRNQRFPVFYIIVALTNYSIPLLMHLLKKKKERRAEVTQDI